MTEIDGQRLPLLELLTEPNIYHVFISELAGSGLGQFGLTAVKTVQMKHLIMSDFHHNVINALDFHSRLNLTDTGRDYNRISELNMVSC